jgi:hypothetical protein
VVQIWPALIVCKQVTVCPGHIWTTLYIQAPSVRSHYCTRYFCPQRLHRRSVRFTTLQNRGTSHKSHQFFMTLHFASLPLFTHITSLHVASLIYIKSPLQFTLFVTIFLILFLKVLNEQGKDTSKPAGNWFQLLMILFTNNYLPTSVLCFLFLIKYINITQQEYSGNYL